MQRLKRHTKSITQTQLTDTTVSVRYLAEGFIDCLCTFLGGVVQPASEERHSVPTTCNLVNCNHAEFYRATADSGRTGK